MSAAGYDVSDRSGENPHASPDLEVGPTPSVAVESHDNLSRGETDGSLTSEEHFNRRDREYRSTERNPDRRTWFNPRWSPDNGEVPYVRRHEGRQRKWDYLNQLDSGRYDRDYRRYHQMHGQQSDIETFGNILGCSDYQIERAKWMWKQVDGVSLSGNFSIEEIALAFLSLAQGTDVHPRFPENPSDDILKEMADVRQQEIWDELIEVNDIDTEGAKPIRKLRGKYHGMV